MSAQAQMRQMLDELMGTSRNGEYRGKTIHFSDSRVCKCFLLSCCPHEILNATKGDIGECPKIHDVTLRLEYENSPRKTNYFFQREVLQHLKSFVAQSDRRIETSKKRLAETQKNLNAEEQVRLKKIEDFVGKIEETLAKAEELGAQGDVEESLKMMEKVEELKKQKEEAEEEYHNALPASIAQQQRLRVCEVCASYLGLNDNDKRLADHFNGKLHLGYMQIREKVEELEKEIGPVDIKEVQMDKIIKEDISENLSQARSISPPRSNSPKRSHHQARSISPPRSSSPKRSHHHTCSRSHSRSHRSEHRHKHLCHHHDSHSSRRKHRHRSRSRSKERKYKRKCSPSRKRSYSSESSRKSSPLYDE